MLATGPQMDPFSLSHGSTSGFTQLEQLKCNYTRLQE